MEEIAAARRFTPAQTVVQIYGTCEECRTGARARTPAIDGATTELRLRARRAAHGDRDRAQRPRVLHARRDAHQGHARPVGLSEAGGRRNASTSARSRSATASCWRQIRSSNRGRRSCSSRAPPTVCSPTGAEQLRQGRQRSSRRCSSASSASAARTSSSNATASGSRTPRASRSSSSSPTKSASTSIC